MSKITYANKVAINENANVPDINKVKDTDMNEIKNVVNANETKILVAVVDTAPSTCSTGDMYFNTTTNLIYTATGTNTWGSTGVAPTMNTIYLELTNQTAYAYNGTTLVSVGGGSSGGGETLPVGAVVEFPTTDSTKVPDGWLFCDGRAVSRTTYADLFAIIGTYFGAGDGSTTFNIPTKEGLVTVGIKSSDTDFDTIGKTGGSKYLQQHNHLMTNKYGNVTTGATWAALSSYDNASAPSTGNVATQNAGTGNSGNLQPYGTSNFIIKATQTTPIQAEVVNDYSTSQENAYSCDYSNKAFGGTILWTNESPTSNFASQDININVSSYNCIKIIYNYSVGSPFEMNTGEIPSSSPGTVLSMLYNSSGINFFTSRTATFASNKITFADAIDSNGASTNNRLVPLYIIGYEKGLF